MKKILALLLLIPSIAFADLYVAEVCIEATEYLAIGDVRASFTVPDGTTVTAPLFEITEAEYNGTIPQAKIDQAIADYELTIEDFSKKMEKITYAFALVVLDEINKLRVINGDTPYNETQLINVVRAKFKTL